ncbi:MAG: ATP-binding protein [Terriglobales bacterium]
MKDSAHARRLEYARGAYRQLLEEQAAGGGEEPLSRAYQLGRELLGAGATLLEITDLHQQALAGWSQSATAAPEPVRLAAGGELLRELLAGFEMQLRGVREANDALHSMHQRMEQRIEQIARSLHDESGQLLTAVMIRLDQLLTSLPAESRGGVISVRQLLDDVELQLRRLAHELHPALLADLGLHPALEYLADGVAARSGLVITMNGRLPHRLPAPVELCLYRCVQECLTNVVRHAQARQVRVRLSGTAAALEIRVGDDGRGFVPGELGTRPGPRGLGLAGIRERLRGVGGELEIVARPGAGAEMRLKVPLRTEGDNHVRATVAG